MNTEIQTDIPFASSAKLGRGTVHLFYEVGNKIGHLFYNRADPLLSLGEWICNWKDAEELEIEVLDSDRPGYWKYNAVLSTTLLPPEMRNRKMTAKLAVAIWNYARTDVSFNQPGRK